jgi:hypothetical protein
MARAIFPALMGAALATNVTAATLEGVMMPDTYLVAGHTLYLNGIGLRAATIFQVKVYVAALYLTQPSHDAQQILASPDPKVIRLQFLHSGSKEAVQQRLRTGEMVNCGSGDCPVSAKADFERFVAAAPAVDVGDTATYFYTSKGVRVFANDRIIGDYVNPDLARLLLAGFIGDHPPTQDLRSHLLGLAGN